MKIMDDKSIRSALVTTPQPATGWDEAAGYAERLAVVLWEKHFKSDAPQWKPLSGDLIGLLTQIDNMTTSLRHEAPAPAEGVTSAELIAALRAFPHFEDDTPVTPDAIRAVAKEYINMVMTWEPQRAALEFLDHAGNQHWLVYEAGDGDLAGGWTLRDDSNLAARPETAESRLREHCIRICLEEAAEWDSDDVQTLKNYAGHCANRIAEETALSPPSGGDEATTYRVEYDGFVGDRIGSYVTREGKRGVVLQQIDTRVVHVYGENRITPVGDEAKESEGDGESRPVVCQHDQRADTVQAVDGSSTAEAGVAPGPSEPSPPADRREIVARIIDPFAFTALDRQTIKPVPEERMRIDQAFAKADAILAAIDGGR